MSKEHNNRGQEEKGETMGTHKSTKCEVCGTIVIVWKRKGISARTLRALALADHIRTLHPELWNPAKREGIESAVAAKVQG